LGAAGGLAGHHPGATGGPGSPGGPAPAAGSAGTGPAAETTQQAAPPGTAPAADHRRPGDHPALPALPLPGLTAQALSPPTTATPAAVADVGSSCGGRGRGTSSNAGRPGELVEPAHGH